MIVAPTLLVTACLLGAEMPADFTLPAPPGPYVGKPAAAPAAGQFRSGSPLVATTYFYWYDAQSKAHVIDPDGSDALTDHPPTLEGFSYNNPDWHAQQLKDMAAAGIDVLLPVYWGTPLDDFGWSDAGLPKLVEARRRLLAEGSTAKLPAIGMFYDTSTLQYNARRWHVDLTTEPGRQWFYGTIRNFFSLIPPEHRAMIDGKPLALLYTASFAKNVDETLFPAIRHMFRRDFGSDLFLVKMTDWPGQADSQYQWGAALAPKLSRTTQYTAGLGPGYDHSAVEGRTPLVRARDGGRFYEFAWQRLLAIEPDKRPWLVHLETWNEFHEGTDICESIEYGRKYIDLTRRYAEAFHAGRKVGAAELTPSRVVCYASPERSDGLWIVPKPDGDGPVAERTLLGRKAWSTAPNRFSPVTRYLYFEVEDYFLFEGDEPVEITIGYYDGGDSSQFSIDYDSADPELTGIAQRFRPIVFKKPSTSGSGLWKEAKLLLPHARFAGGSNSADFRLSATGGDLAVSHVSIRRAKDAKSNVAKK